MEITSSSSLFSDYNKEILSLLIFDLFKHFKCNKIGKIYIRAYPATAPVIPIIKEGLILKIYTKRENPINTKLDI